MQKCGDQGYQGKRPQIQYRWIDERLENTNRENGCEKDTDLYEK